MNRLTLSAVALMLLSFGAHADVKVGVVDVPRLLGEAPQAQAALKQLQQEFAPRQAEVDALRKEIVDEQGRLQRDAAVMGEEERQRREKELRDKARTLERRNSELAEDFNVRRNETLGELQRSLLEEVQTFARDSSYDLIVGDGVLYFSDAVDITGRVLSRLQKNSEKN